MVYKWEKICYLPFWVWLILFNIISSSFCFLANDIIPLFCCSFGCLQCLMKARMVLNLVSTWEWLKFPLSPSSRYWDYRCVPLGRTHLFIMPEKTPHVLHPSVEAYLDWIHDLATVKPAVINVGMKTSPLWYIYLESLRDTSWYVYQESLRDTLWYVY